MLIPDGLLSAGELNATGGICKIVDVILHIGAHRTGTTTLQVFLSGNQNKLSEIGVGFWGPEKTRAGLFSGLVKPADKITHDAVLRGQRSCGLIRVELGLLEKAGAGALIVSEENMIGTMRRNLSEARLYPDAKARLERFATAFGFHCRRIVLSIRSYDEYWASVLAFLVMRGAPVPDTGLLDRLVTQPRRWRDVIRDVADVFPAAEVMVWPFEAIVGQPERQLALMTGEPVPAGMTGKRQWHNASASPERLQGVLCDRGDAGAAKAIPVGAMRWQPFDPHHITALQAQYAEDIAWLRNGAGGKATYLETTTPGQAGAHLPPAHQERGHFHEQEERRMG